MIFGVRLYLVISASSISKISFGIFVVFLCHIKIPVLQPYKASYELFLYEEAFKTKRKQR